MENLLGQISRVGDSEIGKIYMCRINQGMFKVPWSQTKDVISSVNVDMKDKAADITVVRPPGEPL
jgi:hypothetical protein